MDSVVNNWEAAQELQRFKKMYIDDLQVALEKPENRKNKAILEGKLINFSRLHSSMLKLIGQHEDLVDALTEIYGEWYLKISNEGKQPVELMNIQSEIIEELFLRLHNILKPLDLDVK
jgi:hypothetical protein